MARNISKRASRRLGQLARIIARDGNGCVWCGTELTASHAHATVEHVLPLSTGGPNIFENMLLACAPCNHHRQSTLALNWLTFCELAGQSANRSAVEEAVNRISAVIA